MYKLPRLFASQKSTPSKKGNFHNVIIIQNKKTESAITFRLINYKNFGFYLLKFSAKNPNIDL